jgi:AraC-like DNA-binding protein
MPARLLAVTASPRESFRCVRVRQQKLAAAWHYHPEYQLTLVLRGSGQRLVGDSLEPLEPGDLTLIGPNLPHFWDVETTPARRGGGRGVDAVIVQFRAEFLGRAFWGVPETADVVSLLAAASRGLTFPPAVRRDVAGDIVRLPKLSGLQRLLGLIGVLDRLAVAGRPKPLATPGASIHRDDPRDEGLAQVVARIHERLDAGATPPSRRELARLAGLAERSFSRVFHLRFGRTLPQFVNRLRVARARRLLLESPLPVATIAARCGFRNLSNFNTHFRRLTGVTPMAVRRQSATH